MGGIVDAIFGGGEPDPPDPLETARAQIGINREAILESAIHNQINRNTPWGVQTWTGEIGSPNRTQHTFLHPQDEARLRGTRQIQQGLLGMLLNGSVNMGPEPVAARLPQPPAEGEDGTIPGVSVPHPPTTERNIAGFRVSNPSRGPDGGTPRGLPIPPEMVSAIFDLQRNAERKIPHRTSRQQPLPNRTARTYEYAR